MHPVLLNISAKNKTNLASTIFNMMDEFRFEIICDDTMLRIRGRILNILIETYGEEFLHLFSINDIVLEFERNGALRIICSENLINFIDRFSAI